MPFSELMKRWYDYDDSVEFVIKDYDNKGNDLKFDPVIIRNFNEVGYYANCLCNYEGKSDEVVFSFGINQEKKNADDMLNKKRRL